MRNRSGRHLAAIVFFCLIVAGCGGSSSTKTALTGDLADVQKRLNSRNGSLIDADYTSTINYYSASFSGISDTNRDDLQNALTAIQNGIEISKYDTKLISALANTDASVTYIYQSEITYKITDSSKFNSLTSSEWDALENVGLHDLDDSDSDQTVSSYLTDEWSKNSGKWKILFTRRYDD